jgi:hypothetical protein
LDPSDGNFFFFADTVLTIYNGLTNAASGIVATDVNGDALLDDDSGPDPLSSSLTFRVETGGTYYIKITAFGFTTISGFYDLNYFVRETSSGSGLGGGSLFTGGVRGVGSVSGGGDRGISGPTHGSGSQVLGGGTGGGLGVLEPAQPVRNAN